METSVIIQEINNEDFKSNNEKYVVLEAVLCSNNDIMYVARAVFNNRNDAEFYVTHSTLNLVIEEAYLIEHVSKIVPIYFIDIRYNMSSNKLEINKKCTNNFDIKNRDELNTIYTFGNIIHIQKEVDKNYNVINTNKNQIIKVCREIFGYLKDDELYNPYNHVVTKLLNGKTKKKYLDLI